MINAQNDRSFDLARTTFQLLAIGALLASSFWILRPFLVSVTWAIMIVVATWPMLRIAQARLGGSHALAATSMTLLLLLVFVIPFALLAMTAVATARHLTDWSHWLATASIPPPPAWVETLPAIGPRIAERWHRAMGAGAEDISSLLLPYARGVALVFVSQVGSVGHLLLDLCFTVLIAGILYANGETAASGARRFARRLAGDQGETVLLLAGQAVRAVALGVVVTSIVLSALGGIGLAVTGVPFAAILTGVMFVLSVAHIGVVPVMVPAVIWLYVKYGAGWGTGLLVWTIVVIAVDHVLKPLLIKRGADLPLLLVFAGVIGGLLAFGVVGLFIGPVVLAVAYTLIAAWVNRDPTAASLPAMPGERA